MKRPDLEEYEDRALTINNNSLAGPLLEVIDYALELEERLSETVAFVKHAEDELRRASQHRDAARREAAEWRLDLIEKTWEAADYRVALKRLLVGICDCGEPDCDTQTTIRGPLARYPQTGVKK